jgi:hypothetical protein
MTSNLDAGGSVVSHTDCATTEFGADKVLGRPSGSWRGPTVTGPAEQLTWSARGVPSFVQANPSTP